MAEPWKCPECGLILAPWVSEHRCEGGGSAVPAVAPAPRPAGSGSVTVTSGDATTWISPSSQWISGVTVTATNTGTSLRLVS